MKLVTSLLIASGASAFLPAMQQSKSSQLSMSAKSDLESLATKANPTINFYDPLSLSDANFWDSGNDATIGFLRQSELKHGRIAMAAFVGYCVQSNFVWPWAMTQAGDSFPSADLSPEAQWDALPSAAKWQIFTVIAALEIWDEVGAGEREHYMRGGLPGKFPSFQMFRDNVHWVMNLYDPFNLFGKMSQEKKDERLVMEVNNGRLAMIGIMGFMAADHLPGSVPSLAGIAQPYDGNIMAPFDADFHMF